MSSASLFITHYSAAPGRECGSCTLCCKVYALPELEKPPGVWCKHCAPGKGCEIHDAPPPEQCRQFFCLWMTDGKMPDEWRPDRAKFVLTIFPPNGFVYGQVDPGSPGAWRRQPYYDGLRAMARTLLDERRHVIMFVGDEATLVMPDEALPLGKMTARGPVPHRAGLRAQRPDLAGHQDLTMSDNALVLFFGGHDSTARLAWRSTASPMSRRSPEAGAGRKIAATLFLKPAPA